MGAYRIRSAAVVVPPKPVRSHESPRKGPYPRFLFTQESPDHDGRGFPVEGVTGIEPASSAWKAEVLATIRHSRWCEDDDTPRAGSMETGRQCHSSTGPGRTLQRRDTVCRTSRAAPRLVTGPRCCRGSAAPRNIVASRTSGDISSAAGIWRSLVAHSLWERGVVGSNPAIPTGIDRMSVRQGARPGGSPGDESDKVPGEPTPVSTVVGSTIKSTATITGGSLRPSSPALCFTVRWTRSRWGSETRR